MGGNALMEQMETLKKHETEKGKAPQLRAHGVKEIEIPMTLI